jgi:hypothetical protein
MWSFPHLSGDGQAALMTYRSKQLTEPEATTKKTKCSTGRREADAKIIAALNKHHDYQAGTCLNPEPIVANHLALLAQVGEASVSRFFKRKFKGYRQYQALCRRSPSELGKSMELLNGEVPPHILYSRTPPGEGRDED